MEKYFREWIEMIRGVGTDIVEIERIRLAVERTEGGFLERVFTLTEKEYCLRRKDPLPSLAARFAAKEAIMKALGTGFQGLGWQEIEIQNHENGRPRVVLYGRAAKLAGEYKLAEIKLSLSHSRDYAIAFAVAIEKE